MEALNTPVVGPVIGLFAGGGILLFVSPFKQVTKVPVNFTFYREPVPLLLFAGALFLPCSLQGYRLRCLCPGRNAAWPQRAAASCFAQPRVGCGHDALQIRDPTELRRLVGACLKPALPKQNAELCEGPGSAEHHDAPIPSERVARARAARRAAPHPGHTQHPR